MSYKTPISEPIAVIGASCRFAGGITTPSRLWELLEKPVDLSREVPAERFNIKAFYHPDGEHHGTTNSPKAYFIDQDHRVFDASFFNISPKEAEAIDPQQRMMLEVVYEALESAGYTLQRYAGERVAVFAGLMTGDYDTLSQRDELDTSQYYATGNARSILSNRISYFFNFNGPSMTIDTACSSSLVALHQAVLSLRSGECGMACVAGANLILTPEQFVVESSLHMLSPTGHCRMWDAGADGYARGEGIAAIFIKPLSQALADGDRIEAIIRETGVNSDGRSRGITMPNWKAQSQLIQDTYQRAGLDPNAPEDRCQYFEAHGTGTSAGDPNEARAIEDAFFGRDKDSTTTPSDNKLVVGSVKTIIGHTEGAAGLAGLLKVIESMRHSTVPPNLHLEHLNPQVQKYYSHLFVPTSPVDWPNVPAGQPKRGSVNSFGFGGTNAHAIVEQYVPEIHNALAKVFRPGLEVPMPIRPIDHANKSPICLPLVLSAPSQKALTVIVKKYRDYLSQGSVASAEGVAWHAYGRRTAFPFRLAVSSLSVSGLVAKLNSLIAKSENSSTAAIGTRARPKYEKPKILGVFTGQGAQWATMSRGLMLSSRVYANTIRSLDEILRTCPDPPTWSLEQEIMADDGLSRVQTASVSQPLCTAVQLALIELLRHLGIAFHTVIGHSSGEIAAAYAAFKISLRDAILISHYRGLGVHIACSANGAKGGMLAANLTKADATEFCAQKQYFDRLWIAASNAPRSVTLSGDLDAVKQACEDLAKQQKFARLLFVDTAYHSPHMEGSSVKYLQTLEACAIAPAKGNGTNWVSSVYGAGEPTDAELAAAYWKDNMVKPVLFYEAVTTALETHGAFDCAIEIGPHAALKGPVAQIMKEKNIPAFPYYGLLDRKLDDREAFANFLGWMWTEFGSSLPQIRHFVAGSLQPELVNTRLCDAPTYPWDHSQLFYRESRISRQYHFKTDKPHELLGVRTRDDNKHQLRWRNILKFEKLPWVKHHSFQGQALLPASAYLVMTLDAARVALAGRHASVVELRDLRFPSGVILEPHTPGVEVLFNLTIEQETKSTIDASFTLTSTMADGSTNMKKNFSGRLTVVLEEPSASALPHRPKERAEALHASPEAFYEMMAGTGLVYTSPFKALQTVERRYNFSSGTLHKYHPEDTTALSISPATLDGCLQTAFLTISSPGDKAIWTSFLPLGIDCVRFNLAICDIKDRDQDQLAVDAYMTRETPITSQTAASFTADIEIFNPVGEMEIQVQGLTVGSFSSTKPEDDHELYLTTKFDIDPDDEIVSADTTETVYATNPMLLESCERVASFYARDASICRHRPASSSLTELPALYTSWPNETEKTLDAFIRESPYFLALDFIRELGKNLPDVLTGILPAVIDEAHQLVGFQRHVSRVVRQIAHKYPRMNVLGLTDPELGLTEHVLEGLQDAFVLYRVGYEPEKNLGSRIQASDSLRNKIMVDKVDLTTPGVEKGLSYDLVLLATSVIESQKTAIVLQTIKRMMRPGGFLMLVDVSRTPLKHRIRRCAGVVSSGSNLPSPPDWPDVLDQCGFDCPMKNGRQYYPSGFSLIICQADSPEKRILLHPLAISHPPQLVNRLLVVGGKQMWTSLIASGVSSDLASHCGAVETVPTLESLNPGNLGWFNAVIFLNDIDEPVLANMTKERMGVLRALFRPEMMILWVTHNSRFYNPDHAASFGFARTLAAETPGLVLQMLDLDTLYTALAVGTISETFARLATDTLIEPDMENKPLWINEREVHIENGHRLIPRVLPWKDGNARVNAPRRVVSNTVNTLENVVQIVHTQSENRFDVRKIEALAELPDRVTIQVEYSTAVAVNVGTTSYHICLGHDSDTGMTQVAYSESNASYIAVSLLTVGSIKNKALNKPAFLALVSRYLAALELIKAAHGQPILIVGADKMFYECLNNNGTTPIRAVSTDAAQCAITPGMTYLHPSAPLRHVKALYPPEGAWIIDMLPETSKLSQMLVQSLPSNCRYTTYSSVSNSETTTSFDASFKRAVHLALFKSASWEHDIEPPMVTVPDLLRSVSLKQAFQIVDWKAERSVSQIVKPLVGTQLLDAAKTYVLVGLTRDFGQSLCTLFVQQGARHIVLCSRNPPKTQPKWQTEMLSHGITVRFEALDVTIMEQVVAFKSKLADILPPVGGVVNGAMVLEDRVFSQMSLDTLQRVMKPKTVGSRNLDIVFDSPDMDFFIMTSSFAAIGGHAGQSNYAAANMYMNGLAAWRRQRGLPGSVLNIGVIYGLGFLHREKGDLYEGLEREGYPPISERDIHHMFVEAIAAGKPTPDQIYDITTGLRRFAANDPKLAWQHDPRFSHFTTRAEETEAGDVRGGEQKQSLKQLMDAAATKEQLVEVLVEGFVDRLQSQLQLSEGSVTGEHTIVELGVDSLAAVEIRSWAWKSLGQDVAVMKILGGATILKLCTEIAATILESRKKAGDSANDSQDGGKKATSTLSTLVQPSASVGVTEVTNWKGTTDGSEAVVLSPVLDTKGMKQV
ncbi:ketoacyl-synt-domain-containing protein [Parathielavia appendiculata]|uniref:Ketoacyl-synt-domain-containing protein n=1 Tax=Parathielavia appendiculata TaxID=2587402 RepID=A0AAN6Z1J6_9PEZI|nr:ketoacyl-synt-domain-containing protein [Parathielavia appendiculata]